MVKTERTPRSFADARIVPRREERQKQGGKALAPASPRQKQSPSALLEASETRNPIVNAMAGASPTRLQTVSGVAKPSRMRLQAESAVAEAPQTRLQSVRAVLGASGTRHNGVKRVTEAGPHCPRSLVYPLVPKLQLGNALVPRSSASPTSDRLAGVAAAAPRERCRSAASQTSACPSRSLGTSERLRVVAGASGMRLRA